MKERDMIQLRLPSQMAVTIASGNRKLRHTAYLTGDNPQPDGTVIYRVPGLGLEVEINPQHKAVWP
jgi:hypothetical protein